MDRKTYYKIKTSRSNYYAVIERYSDLLYKVHFGGLKKCLMMSLYFDGISHPNIDAYSHHYKCNVSGDLHKSKGSVHMLKTAMRFVSTLYPQLASMPFELIDQSYIPCDNEYELPLSQYYMVHYGKTWYEAKFRAVPRQHALKYHHDVKQFTEELRRSNTMSFAQFCSLYRVPPTHVKHLKQYYKTANTLGDFFQNLKSYDCNIYQKWLEWFVNEHVPDLHGKSWLIPPIQPSKLEIKKLRTAPDKLFVYQKGGEIQKGDMMPVRNINDVHIF